MTWEHIYDKCSRCKKQITIWKYRYQMLRKGFWWLEEVISVFIFVSVGIFQGNTNSARWLWLHLNWVFKKKIFFYWSVVDLQCCFSFRCIAR